MQDILSMIQGVSGNKLREIQLDGKQIPRSQAIIQSMTPKERINPEIINGSRKKRIAMGSGTKVQDINKLLKQFSEARKMMKQISGMQGKKKRKKSKGIFNFPMFK